MLTYASLIYQLNHDLHGEPMVAEGFELCLIPNSCKGEDESVSSCVLCSQAGVTVTPAVDV